MKKTTAQGSLTYSVCTIVNDIAEYNLMKSSFFKCGFTEASAEYIFFDNTIGNKYDAYAALKEALLKAKNRYIIMVHQDVRCTDSIEKLNELLVTVSINDPEWAVCGNAGVAGYHEKVVNITYENEVWKNEQVPVRVKTLDENFLILNTDKKIELTPGLRGFHMYGTDICLHALSNGYTCYVLPFMVQHLSKGNLIGLAEYIPYFINNTSYSKTPGYVETTCAKFYLSSNKKITAAANNPFIFWFIKLYQRMGYIIRKIKGINRNDTQLKQLLRS